MTPADDYITACSTNSRVAMLSKTRVVVEAKPNA